MKKFLLLFGLLPFFLTAGKVSADNRICNKTCQVNEECGQGYRCYVGICRAATCASSTNCECISATPTPSSKTTDVETLRTSPPPQPKVTPMASASAKIKTAPKTGISMPSLFYVALFLGLTGMTLKSFAKS